MLFGIQIFVLFVLHFTTSYYSQMTSYVVQMSNTTVFMFIHTTHRTGSGGVKQMVQNVLRH